MRVFRHHIGLAAEDRGAVVAIGNFDGVHIGHRAVIGAAVDRARAAGVPAAVLTFEPHPRSHFRPDIQPFRLTPFRSKAHQIEALGVDLLFVLHFDHAFSQIEAEAFVETVLGDGLAARHVVVGEDFVFGRGRKGTPDYLARVADSGGFGVSVVSPVAGPDGVVCSSTRIRELLVAGEAASAATLLGRPWEIEGRVEQGDQRGRVIGFPTANIGLDEYLRPANGVYAIRAGLERATAGGSETVWRDGVANLGHRPTFGGDGLVLEAHIFDFSDDIYGRHLRVALVDHLRAEKRFDGIDTLKAQIAADIDKARAALQRAGLCGPAVTAPGASQRISG